MSVEQGLGLFVTTAADVPKGAPPFQCPQCGRFAKFIRSWKGWDGWGTQLYITFECMPCGGRHTESMW